MNKLGLRTGIIGGIGLAALLCAFVACSDDSTTGGTGANGADGGPSNTPGTPGSNPGNTPTAPAKGGQVTIGESSFTVLSNTTFNASASALFFDNTGAATGSEDAGSGSSSCTNTTDGDCKILACDSTGGSTTLPEAGTGGDAGTRKIITAGEITVTGATTLKMTANGSTGFYQATAQAALYVAGQDVTIAAAGADVPAFNTAITPPPAINFTAPTLPALGTQYAVDRSQDLTFTWTGGSGDGKVDVLMTGTKKDGDTTHLANISCSFATSAGTGKISAAALGKTTAGAAGAYSISQNNTKTIDASDYKVVITATGQPKADGDGAMAGAATFN